MQHIKTFLPTVSFCIGVLALILVLQTNSKVSALVTQLSPAMGSYLNQKALIPECKQRVADEFLFNFKLFCDLHERDILGCESTSLEGALSLGNLSTDGGYADLAKGYYRDIAICNV